MSADLLSGAAAALSVPTVALITYEDQSGAIETVARCVSAPRGRALLAEDVLDRPTAVRIVKASLFPASKLLDLPQHDRPAFLGAYKAWRMQAHADARGLDVRNMRPWVDYCPIQMDEEADRWARGPMRFAGD